MQLNVKSNPQQAASVTLRAEVLLIEFFMVLFFKV